MTPGRPRRRISATLLALLLGGASVTVAGATPAPRTAGNAGAAAHADGARNRYGIPPIPQDVSPISTEAEATATSDKAKVSIHLPRTSVFGYIPVCIAFPQGPGLPVTETCCPDPEAATCHKVNPPKTSIDDQFPSWIEFYGPIWPVSPAGADLPFGTFADVRVHTLAFGSIPVAATIHLTQRLGSDGYLEPLEYSLPTFTPTLVDPGVVIDGYGPAPAGPGGATEYSFELPGRVTGPLDLRISDVTVDGRAVDVGSDCRTAQRAQLRVGAPGGFFDVYQNTVSELRGKAGEFQPLADSHLQGTLDIPAFRGCRDGARSADRLITARVSSKHNPVEIHQTKDLITCDVDCPPYPGNPADVATAARAARALLAARQSSATRVLRRATPAQLATLRRAVSRLPRAQRALVERTIDRALSAPGR